MFIQGGEGLYYPGRNLTLRCRTTIILVEANYTWYFTYNTSDPVVLTRDPRYKQTYFTLQDVGTYTCAAFGVQVSVNVEADPTFEWEQKETYEAQSQTSVRYTSEIVIPVVSIFLILLIFFTHLCMSYTITKYRGTERAFDKSKGFGFDFFLHSKCNAHMFTIHS